MRRVVGSASSVSRLIVLCTWMFRVSTTGASPVTVDRFLQPADTQLGVDRRRKAGAEGDAVTLQRAEAGQRERDRVVTRRKSTIRYRPWLSVTAVRTRSIRAGLLASTVTPGRTPPDASRTTR
jgi:hypothetical protein